MGRTAPSHGGLCPGRREGPGYCRPASPQSQGRAQAGGTVTAVTAASTGVLRRSFSAPESGETRSREPPISSTQMLPGKST